MFAPTNSPSTLTLPQFLQLDPALSRQITSFGKHLKDLKKPERDFSRLPAKRGGSARIDLEKKIDAENLKQAPIRHNRIQASG